CGSFSVSPSGSSTTISFSGHSPNRAGISARGDDVSSKSISFSVSTPSPLVSWFEALYVWTAEFETTSSETASPFSSPFSERNSFLPSLSPSQLPSFSQLEDEWFSRACGRAFGPFDEPSFSYFSGSPTRNAHREYRHPREGISPHRSSEVHRRPRARKERKPSRRSPISCRSIVLGHSSKYTLPSTRFGNFSTELERFLEDSWKKNAKQLALIH